MAEAAVSYNDKIVLIPKNKGSKLCMTVEDNVQKLSGLGVYNPGKLLGTPFGSLVTLGRNQYYLLPASTMDHIDTLNRKAQIIMPKDAALLGVHCDLKPGSRVVEGGLGSGALTLVLLSLVGPKGEVTTYETRADFAKIGTDNILKAGLADAWVLRREDITEGISENALDAVILDIPEPWLAVQAAYNSLRAGGTFACYTPTTNQVEKLVLALKTEPFIEIKTFETLQRGLMVSEGSTRPAFEMLGHTGYITVSRKVLREEDKK